MSAGRCDARRIVARMRGEGRTVGRTGVRERGGRRYPMLTPATAVANMQGTEHDIWLLDTDFEYREGQRLPAPGEEATPRRRVAPRCARVLG